MATDPTREQAAEVLTVMAERMERYHELLGDLRAGNLDPAAFRRQVVTTGLILDREGAWIFDLANMRWLYYDGVELRPVREEGAVAPSGTAPRAAAASRRRTRTKRS